MRKPQTIRFEMRVRFDRFERPANKPQELTFNFDSLEKMESRFRLERRRRAIGHRATSAAYRMHLTAYGEAVCEADEQRRESHADAINGKWFDMIRKPR